MYFAWLTDIHLNFLENKRVEELVVHLKTYNFDGFLISGDIADANTLMHSLNLLSQLNKSIYFVLGNHDFYHSSVKAVRDMMKDAPDNCIYLTQSDVIKLTDNIILVGHDGWYDGVNALKSSKLINDFELIEDFGGLSNIMQVENIAFKLAKESVEHIITNLSNLKDIKKVIILTHVPPFKEVSFYRGRPTEVAYLPFYKNSFLGRELKKIAINNPDVEFTVLCGHTHGRGEYKPCSNMIIKVGGAEYYSPTIEGGIEIGE